MFHTKKNNFFQEKYFENATQSPISKKKKNYKNKTLQSTNDETKIFLITLNFYVVNIFGPNNLSLKLYLN